MHGQQNVKISSVSYSACNALAPYCHLWPVRLSSVFPRSFTNGRNFEKELYRV